MECNTSVKHDFVKWIWKWNRMEMNGDGINYKLSMEFMWNRMDCSVEFQVEGNGEGMEINLYLRWNSNGMEWNWNGVEWKWNQNGIRKCYNNLRNIIHNSS